MKNIIIFVAIFFSKIAFAQYYSHDLELQKFDNNGIPHQNILKQMKATCPKSSILTTYTFDSIRSLTEINDTNFADAFPWLSSDGLRLYYTSGANGNSLMFTYRNNMNSYFVSPILVPISISSPSSFWLSSNELDLYICASNHLYYAHRNTVTSSFNVPVLISLTGIPSTDLKGASLNVTQNVLFIFASSPLSKIVELSRTSSTSFNYVRTLPVPSGYIVNSGQLSKDELTFFFSASYNLGMGLLYQLTRATPTDSFAISTFRQIQGINDTTVNNIQATMSDSLYWVSFVRNDTNYWDQNDLYIAHKGLNNSVFNPNEEKIRISVFPNPSNGKFTIIMKNEKVKNVDINIEIYNILGEEILHQQISKEIDISAFPKGVYLIIINDGIKIYSKKIIRQ